MNSHRTSDDMMQRCLKLQIARCRAECRSFAPKIAKNADWVLTTAPACGIIIDVAGSNTPGRHMEYAAVAHLVERHLAKVEVASSSLVGRSNGVVFITPYMVTWPSGKARVCKTLIHQFKSGRHLQKIPGSFSFRDFFVLRCSLSASSPSPSPTVTDSPFCHLR